MSRKTKNILKKIGLITLGVGAVGAVGMGGKALYDYAKNDLYTIHPIFEVGGLGNDGKYVNDELSLYTKESFACEGLSAKLDFDSEISYQFFFYDINDNFISSSEVYTGGSNATIPLNGAYARVEITPKNDEDGKISLKERITYPSQLNLKVSKKAESNVYKKFTSYKGELHTITSSISELKFVDHQAFTIEDGFKASSSSQGVCTSVNFLDVTSFNKLLLNSDGDILTCSIFEFDSYNLDTANITIQKMGKAATETPCDNITFKNSTKVIVISAWTTEDAVVDNLYKSFTLK